MNTADINREKRMEHTQKRMEQTAWKIRRRDAEGHWGSCGGGGVGGS